MNDDDERGMQMLSALLVAVCAVGAVLVGVFVLPLIPPWAQ